MQTDRITEWAGAHRWIAAVTGVNLLAWAFTPWVSTGALVWVLVCLAAVSAGLSKQWRSAHPLALRLMAGGAAAWATTGLVSSSQLCGWLALTLVITVLNDEAARPYAVPAPLPIGAGMDGDMHMDVTLRDEVRGRELLGEQPTADDHVEILLPDEGAGP